MKEIIALQEYTDKYVSLYEGQIRNIQDKLADKLIEQGIVAEHDNDSGEDSSNNNDFIVTLTAGTGSDLIPDKTFEETKNACVNGKSIVFLTPDKVKVYARPMTTSGEIAAFISVSIRDLNSNDGQIDYITYLRLSFFKDNNYVSAQMLSK